MVHNNYQLTHTEARDRLIAFESSKLSPHSNNSNKLDLYDDECLYLLGLMAGESFLFNKSLRLKVIRGSAQVGGHIYRVMDSYRKFIVSPWDPSERLLSLCLDETHNCNSQTLEDPNSCKFCEDVLTQFHGGSCCQFVSTYNSLRASFMKGFGIEYENSLERSRKYTKYDQHIKFYKSQTGQDYDTIVMLTELSSCFGTVTVPEALDTVYPPKIISKQIFTVYEKFLGLCVSGNPVIMLHGDKSYGKSTLVAYTINYLLNFVSNVFLMDVDVGLPFLSAPGLITLTLISESVTTPSYNLVREAKPMISLLLGDIKVSNSPLFLTHVKKCFDLYEKSRRNVRAPLVINTFGWITGMGAQVLEAIASITKVEILVKLVNLPKDQALEISGHEDLKERLEKLNTLDGEYLQKPTQNHKIDTYPSFTDLVQKLGGSLPWDKTNREYYVSSFQNYLHLLKSFNFCANCKLQRFYGLTLKRELVHPSDTRWLRFCSYFNSGFSEALHFPQFRHEEFFGSVETYNFKQNVKFAEKFDPPIQIELDANKYTFVTQTDIIPSDYSQLVPMISGCLVGLCEGDSNEVFRRRIFHQWRFICYAYVHYMDTNNLTLLVSFPSNKSREKVKRSNIIVLCLSYGFEPLPSRLCPLNSYPTRSTPKLEHLNSEMYPFRRNEMLHMVGAYGAGTSAPTQRANLKRLHRE
ncbi:Polynucleotide 5'-hydroxyl-kinase NOL9 [Theileria parva strain Muguga]|uniref:Polynucleotide 5'-hydroxyl-kinase NOL9 n=1 Tax=Theileria parva strain Muguga TaxID=333668 RepID=UPI001C61E249|nr:Polynucleotide 5'-hydroxyl-kinase NOL9 [Theileria parva strain Muguga]EAN31815.2 Polynucleotide 5'-hydroxyl-kinase NOL9 [Theileria parva strain Muguga]